jgi:ribonucleoside-diphosphate reductase alpha chain
MLKVTRVYSKAGDPYSGIVFEERVSKLKNEDGSGASTSIKVNVPNFWSNVASDILAQKYIRRSGVPFTGSETDARQVFDRLAMCWTHWGKKYGYFASDDDASAFYDEMRFMLAHQMAAPNSPQWFNTGLHIAYGITGEGQGHYYVDPETKELAKSDSAYERPQPHACFIQAIKDDLVNEGGIMDLWLREARLFKYGSGTGTNFSSIRGDGEPLSGGGRSSGLMSFLKIGDAAAGAIKSGGTTRRAAKMVCLDLDHPDIVKFVGWKWKEEQKVAALVAGSINIEKCLNEVLKHTSEGFDLKQNRNLRLAIRNAKESNVPMSYISRVLDLAKQGVTAIKFETYNVDWNSEAYSTVAGQNSNNSVRVPNEFMVAVEKGGTWKTVYRSTKEVASEMSARDLWEEIAVAAWNCADPGVQFDTTINEWHTCPKGGRINASNPCSEYMFLDDTACNLASLNLAKFYSAEDRTFSVDSFIHACRLWTIALDISVQMAQFPSKEIAQGSWDYRTLGLGYANIGAVLMQMGLAYGSDDAVAFTGAVTALMTGVAYETSAEMAGHLGAFPGFRDNADDMLRVIYNHKVAATNKGKFEGLTIKPQKLNHLRVDAQMLKSIISAWTNAYANGQKCGYRNAQVSVIAPTGTIGLLMDCDTTGIEPDFALVKFKKLAGGGYWKIINQSVPSALASLGYESSEIEEIVKYCVGYGTINGAPHINPQSLKKKGLTDSAIKNFDKDCATAIDISYLLNLKELGFTEAEIEEANEYVCGTMTLEGCPLVQKEHLPVFDCANKCGKKGQRYISPINHLRMMAAAQPFISGAISKTVNLPTEATIKDIKDCYEASWKMMVKAVALYRDGSKLSQPLSSLNQDWLKNIDFEDSSKADIVKAIAEAAAIKFVAQRKKLPYRRNGYTQKVKIGGQSVFLRTGEYEDGSLGEIFLDLNREGTLLRSIMNSFAVAISIGLQYGVPLEEFIDAFTFARFEPNGVVIGHENIKNSTSIIDFIFRDLGINYAGREDLAHIPVEKEKKSKKKSIEKVDGESSAPEASLTDSEKKVAIAKLKGYAGDPCTSCGALALVRNGSCMKCDQCGTTTGCS